MVTVLHGHFKIESRTHGKGQRNAPERASTRQGSHLPCRLGRFPRFLYSSFSHTLLLSVLISYRVKMITPRYPRTDDHSQHKRKNPPALKPSSPQKRIKLLSDDEGSTSDSTTSSRAGGVAICKSSNSSKSNGFTINSEYARRFEHNKKREELHKCTFT